jgi:hypothetical protein
MRRFTLLVGTAVWVATVTLVGCQPTKPPPDAGTVEDAGDVPDAGPPDAGDAGVVCTQFLDRGYCFEHSASCVSDAGCPIDSRGCSQSLHHCLMQTDMDCTCWGDGDCPSGSFCLSNEQLCGQCMTARPTCQTWQDCPPATQCVGGLCAQPCCH